MHKKINVSKLFFKFFLMFPNFFSTKFNVSKLLKDLFYNYDLQEISENLILEHLNNSVSYEKFLQILTFIIFFSYQTSI